MSGSGNEVEMELAGDIWVISDRDLPAGALPWTDEETNDLLQKARRHEISLYESTGQSGGRGGIEALQRKDYTIEESDFGSQTFHHELHPIVRGYSWYRGYCIWTPSGGEVVLFTGWLQPWIDNAPQALVYTRDNPSVEEVRAVITTYCAGILSSPPTDQVMLLSDGV